MKVGIIPESVQKDFTISSNCRNISLRTAEYVCSTINSNT